MTRPVPLKGEERAKHLEMMQHPELWPMWPLLPMINRSENERMGLGLPGLICDGPEDRKFELVLCTIFQVPEGIVSYTEFYRCAPTKKYEDYEAMLDDGWTVD